MAVVDIVDPFKTNAGASSSGGIVDPFKTDQKAEAPLAWSDVPLEAATNFLPDVGSQIAGAASMAGSNLKTMASYAPYGTAAPGMMMMDAAKYIYSNPHVLKDIPAGIWNDLADHYGSVEALKHTMAKEPARFAMDVATIIGGGEAAMGKIGEIGRAADVSRPFYEGLPSEPPPPSPPPVPPSPPPVPPGPVQQAVQSQPRALTTDNRFLQQTGQFLSKFPLGYPIGKAIEAVPGKFGEARNALADEQGDYRTKENVAGDIRSEIGGQAEAETAQRTAEAQAADAAAQADYERIQREHEQVISHHEQRSTVGAQQQIGDTAPVNMGDAIINTVRESHNAAEAAKNAAYRDAANIDATVLDQANGNAAGSVAQSLRTDTGRGTVDLTAAAAKTARGMMRRIQQFSRDARMRAAQAAEEAGPDGQPADTGQSMRQIEQVRQDLNYAASGAENDADRRAAQRIIQGFDQWHEDAMGHSLMEGSDEGALDAYRNARALNQDFRERFGYNDRNDADATLNKIVQPGDQIGSEDVSKALFAGGDKPGRLLDAIYQATGDHPNHPNVVRAIQGGFWRDLAGVGQGENVRKPGEIADTIHSFMNRRNVADRVFTREQQAIGRAHANTLRNAIQAREEAAAWAKTNKPVPTEVTKGPMQELADRVLGKGHKSDEALFDTIEGYAKSRGGGKDIETLANVMRSIPEELRGNFRNTFIRRLGTGLKGEFSPAKFADEWTRQVNPKAKMVLFGDGAHVRALDELADASKTFDEVHKRFGNPSGSGHLLSYGKGIGAVATMMAAGHIFGPMKVIGAAFGTYGAAHFLASPAGAASAARFATQMRRLQSAPTIANAAALKLAQRNMRNTALAQGITTRLPNED